MKLKPFNEFMLGRDINDPSQLPPVDCSCLHGTARTDAAGNCTCVDTTPPIVYTGPPRGQAGQNGAGGIWAWMPYGNTNIQPDGRKIDADSSEGLFSGTILGFPTGLVAIVAVAAGLYLMTADGKK